MANIVSLAFLFTLCVWYSMAVPLASEKPDEDTKAPLPFPQPGVSRVEMPTPKPGQSLPAPPSPPEYIQKRPVREITPEDPLHLPYPLQLQNKQKSDENKEKSQETTTQKRNKRSDDSDSDEDDRRIENLSKEKPEAKKRPVRETAEERNQHPKSGNPATENHKATETSRKTREATTTPKNPSQIVHNNNAAANGGSTTEKTGGRKVRETEPVNRSGISPLIAKVDDHSQNKEPTATTTSKP